MINSLKISGYKGIDELAIYKIPQIFLIGGGNNVGKSSVLEALFMALDRQNPELLTRHLAFRGIHGLQFTEENWWGPVFHNFNFAFPVQIEYVYAKAKSFKLGISYVKDYEDTQVQQNVISNNPSNNSAMTTKVITHALNIAAHNEGKLVQNAFLSFDMEGQIKYRLNRVHHYEDISGVFIPSTARSNPIEDSVRYGKLDLESKVEQVLEIVRIVEPKIKSLSVVATVDSTQIYAEVDGLSKKIPISLMGDGVGRILTIGLALLTTKNGIVLVDEVENGLHFTKLPALWKAIHSACKSANSQLISTTHNYECLVAASNVLSNLDDKCFAYARVDRQKSTNKIVATQYSGEELNKALAAEYEVR